MQCWSELGGGEEARRRRYLTELYRLRRHELTCRHRLAAIMGSSKRCTDTHTDTHTDSHTVTQTVTHMDREDC